MSGPVLAPGVVQAAQVVTVLVAAPWVAGVIARVEARLQGRRGPRVLQPYYDLGKLFGKEALAPVGSSWLFLAAPVIAVAAYLTVPMLMVKSGHRDIRSLAIYTKPSIEAVRRFEDAREIARGTMLTWSGTRCESCRS